MKVVHVSSSDLDGGAARAAYRLHLGLLDSGVDSRMVVQRKLSSAAHVVEAPRTSPSHRSLLNRVVRGMRRRAVEALGGRLRARGALDKYRKTRPPGYELFSTACGDPHLARQINQMNCDVVHLHWVAGFLDYETFFAQLSPGTRLVWTLHDMNPFTGGCHYDHGCSAYSRHCGSCPQLGSQNYDDLSHEVFEKKHRSLSVLDPVRLRIVTPSTWLSQVASASPLLQKFAVETIPGGINTGVFRPKRRAECRELLGLSQEWPIVMFVAAAVDNRRKGGGSFTHCLERDPELHGLSVGRATSVVTGNPRVHYVGEIASEDLMASVYSSADVVLIPSIQDNLPNVGTEALACGVPIVAYAVGGLPDLVRQGKTGVLVPPGDLDSLGRAVTALAKDGATRAVMSRRCRETAENEFSEELSVRRYVRVYEDLLRTPDDTGRGWSAT